MRVKAGLDIRGPRIFMVLSREGRSPQFAAFSRDERTAITETLELDGQKFGDMSQGAYRPISAPSALRILRREVGCNCDEVIIIQIRDYRLHQFRPDSFPRSLLHVVHLAHQVAG